MSLVTNANLVMQPRRGCFEVREEGGEKFVSLLVSVIAITVAIVMRAFYGKPKRS